MIVTQSAAPPVSNPFCTRFIRPGKIEYRFAGDRSADGAANSIDEMIDRLRRRPAGLIVGPHGSGKTTLLHSLDRQLRDAYVQVARLQLSAPRSSSPLDRWRHRRRWASAALERQSGLADRGLLIIDGLEQLWRPDRRRLLRRLRRQDQTLLATSHTPLGGMAALHRTDVDGQIVAALTDRLLAEAPPAVTKMVRRELQRQDWSRLTNVRELWFDLYDLVQPHLAPS